MADAEGSEYIELKAPECWSSLYKRRPGLVLGFHGCDRETAENVLSHSTPHLKRSDNRYDWLGKGIYFWEDDPWRALDWAMETRKRPKQSKGKIKDPYVIGAVIELGRCFNLLETDARKELQEAFLAAEQALAVLGKEPPRNSGPSQMLRERDKYAIDVLHASRDEQGLPPYQTVRAAFIEGGPIYEGAGFHEKSHVQIAVLDESCIKGYFRLPWK